MSGRPEHPVLELLAARAASRSAPGARDDGARLALVVEGGGMRAVVSAAMTAVLERRGLTRCFDLVVGTSAGALNGAAFIAGVAEASMRAYSTSLVGRPFINPWRLLAGRPAVDVGFSLDLASGGLDAERHARCLASPIELHCVVIDVDTAELADLTGVRTLDEQRLALLATSRLPWVGGPPVELGGRRYLDGGLAEAIPVPTAERAGATHSLVLQTRPAGVARPSGGPLDRVIERRLRALNPDLVALLRRLGTSYEEATAALARRSAQADGRPPYAFAIRPAPGTPVVDRLERRRDRLEAAAEAALARADAVLPPFAT